jgi:CRP-like cAMP-binding protein
MPTAAYGHESDGRDQTPEPRRHALTPPAGELPLVRAQLNHLRTTYGTRTVDEGRYLFRQGEQPTLVFILLHGMIELSVREGRRRMTVQVLSPVSVFGDVPLVSRLPEPFDSRVLESADVIPIPAEDFSRLLRDPRMATPWLVSVSTRMAALQARLIGLLTGRLEDRLALLLLQQAQGDTVRLSQETLADLLGANRSSVNRSLHRLQNEGMIDLRYREIRLVERERLWATLPGAS